MTRIEEIRARLAAATPGPWRLLTADEAEAVEDGASIICEMGGLDSLGRRCWQVQADLSQRGMPHETGALIASAPADLAYLLSEVERLTRERDAADAQVRAWSTKLGEALGEVAKLVPVADAEAVAAATAAERERAARVCERRARELHESEQKEHDEAVACAAAIRRGGE